MSALARRLFGRNLRGSALTVRPSHSTSDIVYMAPQPPVDCSDKSRRQLRKEEKVEYYKKLNNMIHTDPDLNISEDKLAEFADGAFKNIMRLGKQNRFQDALRCYDATKHLQSPSRHYFTISFLIGACQTAELLPAAIRLFNEMSTNNFVPNEAAYVSLIRCFCDAGNEQAAIEIIGKMFSLGVEIKLRCCHPIVEVLCRDGDVANLRRAFEFIDYMTDKSVKIQTEQLIVLLDGIFKSEAKRHADIIDRMQQLLVMCSEYIFCLPDEEFLRLAASIRQIGIADITKEGVLTSDKYRDELNQFMGSVKLATEESAALSAGHNMHLNLLTAKELASRKPAAAAHVNIPHTAAVCPNCGGTLSKNFLPPDEQKRVRDALFGFAAAAGAGHMAHLKRFSNWLQKEPEFDYIIDAANLAYTRQNHQNGKFSFLQIEVVVDLLLSLNPSSRVLIIIPNCYLFDNIRNSISRNSQSFVRRTSQDQRIIDRFKTANMIYEVPKGANDDWYWIFATLYEGRRKHARVLTNDRMRDHKLAFMEPRPFLRWRNAHVTLYDLVYTAEDDTKPLIQLREPAVFGREIQFTDNGWLHVPSADNDSWLCADIQSGLKAAGGGVKRRKKQEAENRSALGTEPSMS